MSKPAGLFLCLLAFSAPAFAQERACTQIGCLNGAHFAAPPDYDWKNGNYDIQVALDFKTVYCRGKLPLNRCDEEPSFTCDDRSVTIGESGCALPDKQHGISGIHINADPAKIRLRIARNNIPVITQTVVPQYKTSMPNGPGCGPVCRSASYDLLGLR